MRCTSGAACTTMMAPVKSAVTTTIGSDLTPILYMARRSSRRSKSKRTKRRTMRPPKMPMAPSTDARPSTRSRAASSSVLSRGASETTGALTSERPFGESVDELLHVWVGALRRFLGGAVEQELPPVHHPHAVGHREEPLDV